VCEELLECDALHGVALQQAAQQAPAGWGEAAGNVVRQARLTGLNVAQQLDVVGAVVGRLPHQQLKQDGADGPQVSLRGQVGGGPQDAWPWWGSNQWR